MSRNGHRERVKADVRFYGRVALKLLDEVKRLKMSGRARSKIRAAQADVQAILRRFGVRDED